MTLRRALPHRRLNSTIEIKHAGQNASYKATFGYFANGEVGEVFISAPKIGSLAEGIARDFAILLSLSLQYRIPLDIIRSALTRNADGTPQTIAGEVVDRIEKLRTGDEAS